MKPYILKFIVAFVVFFLTLPAFAGPYEITFPIDGVTSEHQSAISEIFEKRKIDSLLLKTENGVVRFFTGDYGMESLLKLSDVAEALKEMNLGIRTETWILKEQITGVCLSTEYAIGEKDLDKAIQSFKDVEIKILGTVLIGGQLCKVLHLTAPIDYSNFEAHLEQANIKINDLVWGHWEYGWGVEGGHHDRAHSFGALVKPRIEN